MKLDSQAVAFLNIQADLFQGKEWELVFLSAFSALSPKG